QGLVGEVDTLRTKTFILKDHVDSHPPRPMPPKEPNGTDRKKPFCIGWYKSTSEFSLYRLRRKPSSGLSDFVKDEFGAFHGMLAHGFLCLRCTSCAHEKNGWPFSANGMDCAFRAVGNAWRRRLLTWLITSFSGCRCTM